MKDMDNWVVGCLLLERFAQKNGQDWTSPCGTLVLPIKLGTGTLKQQGYDRIFHLMTCEECR